MFELDLIDKNILYELILNARQTYSRIAKKLGTSKQLVSKRIHNLMKKKILMGFWAVIDYHKIGFECSTFFLKLKLDQQNLENKVNQLCRIKNIGWLARCCGKWDLIITLFYEDFSELNQVIEKIFCILKGRIIESLLLHNLKNYSLPLKNIFQDKKDFPCFISGEGSKNHISLIDFKILKILSRDCRINILDVAEEVKISIPTAKDHIKNLLNKKVIIGFSPIINFGKLGFIWNSVLVETKKYKDKKFIEYLKNCSSVTFITPGISNIVNFDILVRSPEELRDCLNSIRSNFQEYIKSIENTLIISMEKNSNFLPKKPSYLF